MKKRLLLLVSVIALLLIIAACSTDDGETNGNNLINENNNKQTNDLNDNDENNNDEGTSAEVTEIPNEYDEPYTLADDELLIFIENFKPFELDGLLDHIIGDKLKEQFPDYNIKLAVWDKPIRTTDLLDAGVTPDIYIGTSRTHITETLKGNDWHFDMTELIDEHDIDLAGLNQGAVEMVKSRSDGGMYGVPLFIREYVMFYNKNIFDAFEHDYPENGMTYDEVFEMLPNVMGQAGPVTYKGYSQHPDQYLDFNQLGLYPFTPGESEDLTLDQIRESVNITTDEWLRLVENMYRFLVEPGNNFTSTEDFFRQGNYAMAIDTIDNIYQYRMSDLWWKESDIELFEGWAPHTENVGVASIPVLSEEDNWTYQPNLLAAHVTADSDKKEQAMEVIKWLVSEEAQLELSKNGLKAVLETDDIVEQFATNITQVADIENFGEAVYWGENAQVQNYENTEWMYGFPLYYVFRENVLQLGNPPDVALESAAAKIDEWYGWYPEEEEEQSE